MINVNVTCGRSSSPQHNLRVTCTSKTIKFSSCIWNRQEHLQDLGRWSHCNCQASNRNLDSQNWAQYNHRVISDWPQIPLTSNLLNGCAINEPGLSDITTLGSFTCCRITQQPWKSIPQLKQIWTYTDSALTNEKCCIKVFLCFINITVTVMILMESLHRED